MEIQLTVQQIIQKARAAEIIDDKTASELAQDDLQDVLGALYGYILVQGKDPDALFQQWNITA